MREQMYSTFGPFSLLPAGALGGDADGGLCASAVCDPLAVSGQRLSSAAGPLLRFRTDLYVSGTTLTTLGLGDVVPRSELARALMIAESRDGAGVCGAGHQLCAGAVRRVQRREVSVAMLDGRAGSPPTAAELLRRHGFDGGQKALSALLEEWERWSAEILESHISYPILCYYRSQHDNQSWLSALVSVLDACALLITTDRRAGVAAGAADVCDGAACADRPGARVSPGRTRGGVARARTAGPAAGRGVRPTCATRWERWSCGCAAIRRPWSG